MIGTLIGDLAAWTYEHDKDTFWKQLVPDGGQGAQPSVYGHAIMRAASKNVLDVPGQDVGFSSRLFFPKNAALTIVERHVWQDCSNDFHKYDIGEDEKKQILQSGRTGWENRYYKTRIQKVRQHDRSIGDSLELFYEQTSQPLNHALLRAG